MNQLSSAIIVVSTVLQIFGTYVYSDEVTVSLAAESGAAGFPVIVNVTLTNSTHEKISWWCGGPDVYPGAEHFTVRLRYNAESEWHDAMPTNGQYVQGSGFSRHLGPGESIVVPLAIPIDLPESTLDLAKENGLMGSVAIRVSCGEWKTAEQEVRVDIRSNRKIVDSLRQRIIGAILNDDDPFGMHLASRHADPQSLDALLKLATVDCGPVASNAARALVSQPELPSEWGEELSLAARRWFARKPELELGGIQENMVAIALKTQSSSARNLILDLLQTSSDSRKTWSIINALRLSPGDSEWLERARIAIEAVRVGSPDDEELARQVDLASKWLDSRLQNIITNGDGRTKR